MSAGYGRQKDAGKAIDVRARRIEIAEETEYVEMPKVWERIQKK